MRRAVSARATEVRHSGTQSVRCDPGCFADQAVWDLVLGLWIFALWAQVCHLLFPNPVENPAVQSPPPQDITFACTHCASALVVNAGAAGMTLPCQRCGKPTVVPDIRPIGAKPPSESAESGARVGELRRQLKENESQRTEITGYINQLSIQLHRWQLRLQTLEERRQQLDTELRSLK